MTRFELKVVASDHVFYDGPCVSLTIPCTDGEKQILAHHWLRKFLILFQNRFDTNLQECL